MPPGHETQELMLEELRCVKTDLRAVIEQVTLMRIEVAALKVKAGVWGAMAGAVPALGALAIWLMSR